MPKKDKETSKPKAFVIMQFDDEFKSIYEAVFRPVLKSAGYKVVTGGIQSQQSIIKDIITLIAESKLVLADLTVQNANVFYELGLAHALCKKVIHVTQDFDSLPFDLRSYRTIHYSTHIGQIDEFKKELKRAAKGALDGNVSFGNPVIDFLPNACRDEVEAPARGTNNPPSPNSTEPNNDGTTEIQAEREFLDYVADTEKAFDLLNPLLLDITQGITDIGAYANKKAQEVEKATKSTGSGRALRILNIVRDMAGRLNQYGTSLKTHNDEYERIWQQIDNSFEAIVGYRDVSTDEERTALLNLLKQANGLRTSAEFAVASIAGLRESVAKLKDVQANLSSAARMVESELTRLIDNIERTRASAIRALEIGKEKLGLPDDYDFAIEE